VANKPLTASSKCLKEMELALLEVLMDSNDAVDLLMDLWMREPEDAAGALCQIEQHCYSPGLVQEERVLRDMIDYYQTDWVKPMSRLALVLFTKGIYDKATRWCETVLAVKPWHCEVAQFLIVVQLRQQNFGQALLTACRYALPALKETTEHKRRQKWVQWATAKAKERLQRAQVTTAVATLDEQLEECPLGGENVYCWE
jgi:hypothetical protein